MSENLNLENNDIKNDDIKNNEMEINNVGKTNSYSNDSEIPKDIVENNIDDSESENKIEVKHSFRSNLYEKIDVSVKTMDIVIGFIIVLIIIFVVFGIIQGAR